MEKIVELQSAIKFNGGGTGIGRTVEAQVQLWIVSRSHVCLHMRMMPLWKECGRHDDRLWHA